eukprot:4290577-Pleurochrysis_carterae.AAC.1
MSVGTYTHVLYVHTGRIRYPYLLTVGIGDGIGERGVSSQMTIRPGRSHAQNEIESRMWTSLDKEERMGGVGD